MGRRTRKGARGAARSFKRSPLAVSCDPSEVARRNPIGEGAVRAPAAETPGNVRVTAFPDSVSHGTRYCQNSALYRPNQQALTSRQQVDLSASRLTRPAPAAEVLAVVQQHVVGAFSEPGARVLRYPPCR